jgi:hypothetical protein
MQRFDGGCPEVVPYALAIELMFKRLKSLARIGHVPKHDDRSSRAWLYGKLLIAHKNSSVLGATFPPGVTQARRGAPPSPWREFSFALHQIQQAIEPRLPLQQTLFSWNQIARALAENSRTRSLQLAKWETR